MGHAELKRRIESDVTLVLDVRSETEFQEGNIKTAINIPVEQLELKLAELEKYIDQSISIVCRTDKRSAKAANLLLKHGFHDVRVVQGGMTEWVKA